MSAALAPASHAQDALNRLPTVSRLAARLASHVVESQIKGQPVPDTHIRSLLDAALLLQEHGVALPSLLEQIMEGVAEPAAAPKARMPRIDDADDAGRLAWLLRPFQDAKA